MFNVKSQIDFCSRLKKETKSRRSHILFLKEIPTACLDAYVKKDLLKCLELSEGRRQYYITEKFIELTEHL